MDKTLYTSWGTPVLVAVAVGGLVAAGCQRQTPPPTDSKSIQKHAEELKKQNEREMKNK
jgi:hypothetical protein